MTHHPALRRMVPVLGLGMLALGLAVVWRAIGEEGPAHVVAQLDRIPPWRLVLAGLCSAGGYLALTGFDHLGLAWAGRRLAYRHVAWVSFVSLSLGHNIGLGGLGSGTLRYRLYSTWGVGLSEVACVVLFSGLTVLIGLVTLAGVALPWVPDALGLSRASGIAVGVVCLAAVAAYLVAGRLGGGRLLSRRLGIVLPDARVGVMQVGLGAANYLLEAAVLHQVLAAFADPGYLTVVAVYVVAILAGLVSQAPGGLGVIEAVVLALLPGGDVVPALIAYRALYYWIPGLAGGALLAAFEWRRRRAAPRMPASSATA